jgi:hypothetical protein
MGPSGAKMVDFKKFKESLDELKESITSLSTFSTEDLQDADSQGWEYAHNIFTQMNIMESNIKLIAHSKVMAHLFPLLFGPIDRSYTLKFLYGTTSINGSTEYQWKIFKKIHREFYYPILHNEKMQKLTTKWMQSHSDTNPWDTSPLKIIDNLVIGQGLKEKEDKSSYQQRKKAVTESKSYT